MRNQHQWTPSRIVPGGNKGEWVADETAVAACSQFIVSLQTPLYVRAIQDNVHGRLLDCGCGQAPHFGIYKDLVTKVDCIDWGASPHEVQYADKLSDLNETLPYKNDTFDSVLLADVLEHIHSPAKLVSEISRTLKPKGKLVCFVPFSYWLHEDPHDYHRYTEYALRKMCEDNNLNVDELYAYGGGWDVVFDMILKLNRDRLRTVRFLTWAFKRVRGTKMYQKNSSWGLKKLPLGYILIAHKHAT